MKRILFFDIDGCLTRTIYDKADDPLIVTLSTIFGKPITKEGVVVSGGTAQQITIDILTANGISLTADPEKLAQIGPLYTKNMTESIASGKIIYQPCPNVAALLDHCAKSDEFELALVTGNMIDAAEMKLEAAGLNADLFKRHHEGEYKLIGGFGNDDAYRPRMVAAAMKRFNTLHGKTIPPSQFLVIGDTPKDIWCAHENDVPAIGVATGIFNVESLTPIADCALENFSDLDHTVKMLATTKRIQRDSYNYDITADNTNECI